VAVTTVIPDATATGAANFTLTGAPSLNAALADGSDATYAQKLNTITGSASALLHFGTLTVLATQQIKRVRIRTRVSTPTTSGKVNIYLGARVSNVNNFHSALAIRGQYTSATTFTGPWQTSSPDGTSWSQADINGLRAKITEYSDTTDRATFYELYIDVDLVTQPTVTTVTAPSGTITTTASPDITWTYSDTDNETQSYYQIKVFSAAQYGAGGFSPATSTATWNSGEIASSDNASIVGYLLPNATYRCYIRAAKTVNNAPFWSDYTYSSFVINCTSPTTPTLVASWNSSLGYASFTITGAALPSGYSSQYYVVERSDDAGITYSTIRNGSNITPVSYVGTATDYEAPRTYTVYYRARAIGITTGSVEIPSTYSTVQQVLITNDSTWWFKVPASPTLNVGSVNVLNGLNITVEEPNTIFRPLGDDRPIVVAGTLQGKDGRYTITTTNNTQFNLLLPVINYQGTLLVQDPLGNQKYIRITKRSWTESTVGTIVRRLIDIDYVEVSS